MSWRATLVKAPRLVPLEVLRYTCPEGPFPFKWSLKSPRGKHEIPLVIWVPRPEDLLIKGDDVVGISEAVVSKLPVVIDFHGGGFVLGSCLEQAPSCAQFCREFSAVVISVDYRMGPIDKFPTAIWDGEDVLKAVLDAESHAGRALREAVKTRMEEGWQKWAKVQDKKEKKDEKAKRPNPPSRSSTISTLPTVQASDILDPSRIAISGFSSGGNLALNLGLDIKQPDLRDPWPSMFPPEHQFRIPLLLFYPSLDARQLPSQRNRPANMPPSSPFWTAVDDILLPSYLPRQQTEHPRASPGLANAGRSLHPKAKVLLVLPEFDNLAEQAETWVKHVYDAGRGSDLEVVKFAGMKHGWTQFPVSWLSEAERTARAAAFRRAIDFVREAWTKDF